MLQPKVRFLNIQPADFIKISINKMYGSIRSKQAFSDAELETVIDQAVEQGLTEEYEK